jgi:S-DNA-T family DNA segregation ATPase FtsK/SpoIIIE
VVLDDPEISRRHLIVNIDDAGIRIADTGSTNGTFVGGAAILGETQVAVGQAIELGGSGIAFEIVSATTHPAPDPIARSAWGLLLGDNGDNSHDSPVYLDLSDGHVIVVGPYRSGRSSTLARIAMAARHLQDPPELHLLAPRRSPLTELTTWSSVAIGREDVELAVTGLGTLITGGRKAIVVIDDGEDLLQDDSPDFEQVLRAGRDSPLRFVIAVESTEAHRTFGGWFVEARKQKHAVFLQPDPILDGDLVGVQLPREPATFEAGSGYLFERGTVSLVRVATNVQE